MSPCMSVALPAYSPGDCYMTSRADALGSSSSPAPSYAALPRTRCGESTVEYTPRAGLQETPLGNLTKQWRDVTIIFKNQDDSLDTPTYGRNSRYANITFGRGFVKVGHSVCGEIGLENSETVKTICLKVIIPCSVHCVLRPVKVGGPHKSLLVRLWVACAENCG